MDIALTLMLSEMTVSIVEAAPAAEERGFEALFIGEHTHCPVGTSHSYTTGRYGTGKVTKEGYLPDFYKRFPDPYITLTAAAMCTTTIRLGTCIALPAEHNPIVLAKEIATLDQLSNGRFEFGIGYGWNEPEMLNNGFAKKDRRKVLREKIAAMKALWTEEIASFDGEFVKFTDSWSYPKPAQKPHPPVLIGAAANQWNIDDIVDWADGWMPVRVFEAGRMPEAIGEVRHRAEERGRDPESIAITVVDGEGGMGGKRGKEEFLSRMPTPEVLDEYLELGIKRLSLTAPVHDRDFMLWAFDQFVDMRERLGNPG